MTLLMSRARSPQNVRVAARSRIFSSRSEVSSPAPQDWLPEGLRVEGETEAIPADPAAAAELGAEVQRLRGELSAANERADRAESEAAELRERAEAMKRAAAEAAAAAHPEA
jgi:molecular chaperone GrpE (heat shock protein)